MELLLRFAAAIYCFYETVSLALTSFGWTNALCLSPGLTLVPESLQVGKETLL